MEVRHRYRELDQEASAIAYVAKKLRHTLSQQLSSKEKRGKYHILASDGDAIHAEECLPQSMTLDPIRTSKKSGSDNTSDCPQTTGD